MFQGSFNSESDDLLLDPNIDIITGYWAESTCD